MRGPLRRKRRTRVIAGVCAGVAQWLAWKPWVVRTVFVVGSVIPILPGFLVYALLWLLIPLEEPGPEPGAGLPLSA